MIYLAALIAYLIGSIPFGYILVRIFKRVDVRKYGSNNVGAINVFRVGGPALGIATILADAGKATLVTVVSSRFFEPWGVALLAWVALLGHAYSIYFYLWEKKFSEGKCVASGMGVLLGLTCVHVLPIWVLAIVLGVWITGLLGPKLLTGKWSYISPATMCATGLAPILVWISAPQTVFVELSFGMSSLILIRHKNNIRRLLNGQEPKLGERLRVKQDT